MQRFPRVSSLFLTLCALTFATQAGQLAIVIDDFGYRPKEENKILQMPTSISIAILPNAPYAREMAIKARDQNREILIHLPMAPISKQPLEKDTLQPSMSEAEIQRIIRQAVNAVPYAIGMNNHMGSAMTANLEAMRKVMRTLEQYPFRYFLDSVTIGSTQVSNAAEGTRIRVLKRRVFLDDSQQEAEIRTQLNRAIQLVRKEGSAIAIGHPHPSTVRVLQQMLPSLPSDITLVRPSALLDGAISSAVKQPEQRATSYTPTEITASGNNGIKQCLRKKPLSQANVGELFSALGYSVAHTYPVRFIKSRWSFWFGDKTKTVERKVQQ